MQNDNQKQTTSSYGKWMLFLTWIAILGLGYLFFSDKLYEIENPNPIPETTLTPQGTVEVVLLRNHYGHYIATGDINFKDVDFIVDTGATNISIPDAIARRIELQLGPPHLAQTANGTVTVYETILDSVAIGGIRLSEVKAHINPHMQGKTILLGMSFLKHIDFSQSGNQLILKQRLYQ